MDEKACLQENPEDTLISIQLLVELNSKHSKVKMKRLKYVLKPAKALQSSPSLYRGSPSFVNDLASVHEVFEKEAKAKFKLLLNSITRMMLIIVVW